MLATDTIMFFEMNTTKSPKGAHGDIVLETIGDRLLHLLRTCGRADRGSEYEQKELATWLSGEAIGPNGKRYDYKVDHSYVNRLVGDKMKRFDVDILAAICEIFNTDMDWLCRGVVKEEEDRADIFMVIESSQVAALIERMEPENRELMLTIARRIVSMDDRVRNWDYEIAAILARNIDTLPANEQARAELLLRQLSPYQRNRGSGMDRLGGH